MGNKFKQFAVWMVASTIRIEGWLLDDIQTFFGTNNVVLSDITHCIQAEVQT
jgi:hypothetical protein